VWWSLPRGATTNEDHIRLIAEAMAKIFEIPSALAFLLSILTSPLVAVAQQPARAARIGFLWTSSPEATSECVEAFRRGLHEAGYAEGSNVAIEHRWAADAVQRLGGLATELVDIGANIIVTQGTPAAQAAKRATTTIPIVMATSGDPVGTKLVASLARPGGNVTGLSLLVPELNAKRLELVREANPKVSRVAVILDANNPDSGGTPLGQKETEVAAHSLGLRLQILRVRGPEDFGKAFATASSTRADVVIVLPSPILSFHWRPLVDLAVKHRLPTIFGQTPPVEAGGLMAYGPSYADLCRRATGYVEKILKGAKPADLPIEQPTKVDLVINLKTAKQLGLSIPQSLLARADRLIE
jgi:putative tryptophan/tyrosine transport system substrate-binding protein